MPSMTMNGRTYYTPDAMPIELGVKVIRACYKEEARKRFEFFGMPADKPEEFTPKHKEILVAWLTQISNGTNNFVPMCF